LISDAQKCIEVTVWKSLNKNIRAQGQRLKYQYKTYFTEFAQCECVYFTGNKTFYMQYLSRA